MGRGATRPLRLPNVQDVVKGRQDSSLRGAYAPPNLHFLPGLARSVAEREAVGQLRDRRAELATWADSGRHGGSWCDRTGGAAQSRRAPALAAGPAEHPDALGLDEPDAVTRRMDLPVPIGDPTCKAMVDI